MNMISGEGFEEDCYSLINTYCSRDSTDFQLFCEDWKQKGFHYVFYGHAFQHELLLYSENCFTILKNIFTKSIATVERVAILYLMYAMYFKQPANNFCKFRCTYGDWTKIKQFYDSISVDAKYLQARAIFWRLWQHNAFRFVDCDREHYPETMQFHRLQNDGLDNFQKINATIVGRLNELQSERRGLLSAIGTLQMGYNEMKEHFASTQGQCTELQSIDVVTDIDAHMTNVRKLFESKYESFMKKPRKEHVKSVKRMLLAGPSKSAALIDEQDSDLDSDLNESNDESTSYSEYEDCGDGDGDDGDDDDSNCDDVEVDECLNIGTKRYLLKRKAEQHIVGGLHSLKSSVFPSAKARTPTKSTPRTATTTRTVSIEETPLSIVDVDGKIVISQPKKVYNRYSKEYRSAVRKQFIDCPEEARIEIDTNSPRKRTKRK